VTVNEKEIEPYLPAIYAELQDLDKEDIIRRFVSIEFNRFLEYYRRAPDLNVDMNSSRRDRDSAGGSDEGFRPRGQRMFVSVGAKDGLDKGQLLRFLCDESGERGSVFGKIDVKGVYSFVDVQPDRMEVVMQKINGCEYRGRTVKVELTEDRPSEGGGGRREGGGYRGGSRDGGSRDGGGGGYRGGSREGGSGGYRGGSRDGGSTGGSRRSEGGNGGYRGGSRDGGSREGGYKKKEYSDSSPAPRSDERIASPSSEGTSRKDKFKKW
jgi:ATP-dependent RNA helicase DeaD